jgi:acetaldehyde dehydrogenase/alcohol dehydrogenase
MKTKMEGYIEVAEPVGVVAGVTPVTNPTSTTMFKSLICIKTRHPIIFGFSSVSSKMFFSEAARILKEAAIKHGAPEHCIQWIEVPSIEATNLLIENHPGVSMILATGGSGMVKSAYSAGKPARVVGPGNVPCYITQNVNLKRACKT